MATESGNSWCGFWAAACLLALVAGFVSACRAEPQPEVPFVSHAAQLFIEMRQLPASNRLAVKVEEEKQGTHVLVESAHDACDGVWLKRAYADCVAHRRRHHGDKNCTVVFHYPSGTCSLP
jgi:hypothetical protein